MSSQPHAGHHHGDLVNANVAHEGSDINVRAILWFVAVLTAIVIAIDVAMLGMFKVLDMIERKNEPAVSPQAVQAGTLPPEPRLQTTPWTDLQQLRASELSMLHGYGWIDQSQGIARIPIEKAKALLLQQGLPVRPELGDPLEGTHVAATGESNGGRTLPAALPDRSSPVPAPTGAPMPPAKGGGGQ